MKSDPTWNDELKYFKKLINSKKITDFSRDIWIQKQLHQVKENKIA